jgi:type I restriction enzyme M protein
MIVRTTVKSIQDIMRQDVGVDGDAQRISQLCWMFFLKIIDDQDQELELTKDGYRSPIPKKLQWRNWAADPEGVTGQALLDFINDELFPALKGLQLTGKSGDRRRVVRDVFEDAYNYMKSGQLRGRWSTRSTRLISTISTSGGTSASSTSSFSTTFNPRVTPANIIRRAL